MKKAVRCATNGVMPLCAALNSKGSTVVTRSAWKVNCFGRGLSRGRSRARAACGASSSRSGAASMRPWETQCRLQWEKSTYCTLSSGRPAAAAAAAAAAGSGPGGAGGSGEDRSRWSSRWKHPWERMSKFMWCVQRITSTSPFGRTAISARIDASSASLKGVRPTSPMRASAAASSETRRMLTGGATDVSLRPGGDTTTVLERTSWREMTLSMHDRSLLGFTPPAIQSELETL
mmetsp:Transcript_5700/g.16205  ORF Transcript_5700/g.16205 Transcript_5700/m.16205 type:complete len:233 (+) Transcript_5700:686-1384(+)